MAEVESQRKRDGGDKEKRAPRLQRPVLPSAEPMKQKVTLLREEINKRQERISEIKAILDQSRGGARGAESRAIQNELGEIRGEFNKLLNQKKAVREQLQQSDQTREQVRSSAKQLKEKLQYTSVAEIDKQMKLLEDKLNYEDVGGIQNEKKIIERIKQLAESKKFVQSYSSKIQELEKGKDSRQEVTERLDKLNAQLDSLSAKEKALRKKLDEQRNQRGKQEEDRDSLTTEKQDCYEIIKASRDQISTLQQEYNEEFEQYKVKLEEYKKQAAAAKEERDALYKADREAKDAERKKRDLELAGAPYSEHILRCDQLIQFLSKYVSPEECSKDAHEELSNSNSRSSTGSDLSGMKMVRRKGEEQDDPLAGTLTRTGGKKGRKAARGNSTAATASKKMVLDLDLITAFKFVGVRTPAGVEEAGDLLKEVQAKKEEYKEKQKTAEQTGVLDGSSGKEEEISEEQEKKESEDQEKAEAEEEVNKDNGDEEKEEVDKTDMVDQDQDQDLAKEEKEDQDDDIVKDIEPSTGNEEEQPVEEEVVPEDQDADTADPKTSTNENQDTKTDIAVADEDE